MTSKSACCDFFLYYLRLFEPESKARKTICQYFAGFKMCGRMDVVRVGPFWGAFFFVANVENAWEKVVVSCEM